MIEKKQSTTALKKLKKVDEIENEKEKKINEFVNQINIAYMEKKGSEIDSLIKKLFQYYESVNIKVGHQAYTQLKNNTWQKNHVIILASINNMCLECNRMPTITEISKECGLSHETVYKHLNEFKEHDLYKHEMDKYNYMVQRVLNTVVQLATKGNIKACKIFLDYFKESTPVAIESPNTTGKANYIQINNTFINQDIIQQLKPEQLNSIESILKSATLAECINVDKS